MDKLFIVIVVYLAVMNFIGFYSMFSDKNKAKKGKWRTKESTLFLFAILGGSLGSNLGMRVFRHKTDHWYFKYGMPIILILQILLAFAIIYCVR